MVGGEREQKGDEVRWLSSNCFFLFFFFILQLMVCVIYFQVAGDTLRAGVREVVESGATGHTVGEMQELMTLVKLWQH